ncbi:YdeI/OmpD-associated family protein [Oerskovia sp. M15]
MEDSAACDSVRRSSGGAAAEARTAFDALSYSRKRALVEPIGAAKTPETRQRRIEKAIAELTPRRRAPR